MNQTIDFNDTVTINYSGKFKENNEVFDSSDISGPFEFIVGSDNVIDGINEAIIGMQIGDKKVLDIEMEKGYGSQQEDLVISIPTEKLPENSKVGDTLDEAVTQMQWVIRELGEETSIVDGNHPLAGRDLIFSIEVIDLEKTSLDEE